MENTVDKEGPVARSHEKPRVRYRNEEGEGAGFEDLSEKRIGLRASPAIEPRHGKKFPLPFITILSFSLNLSFIPLDEIE